MAKVSVKSIQKGITLHFDTDNIVLMRRVDPRAEKSDLIIDPSSDKAPWTMLILQNHQVTEGIHETPEEIWAMAEAADSKWTQDKVQQLLNE